MKNFFESGEDDEGVGLHEVWVLQGDVGREQRFGDAAADVHAVEGITAV